jgi:hypothetical protein
MNASRGPNTMSWAEINKTPARAHAAFAKVLNGREGAVLRINVVDTAVADITLKRLEGDVLEVTIEESDADNEEGKIVEHGKVTMKVDPDKIFDQTSTFSSVADQGPTSLRTILADVEAGRYQEIPDTSHIEAARTGVEDILESENTQSEIDETKDRRRAW